MTYKFKTVSEAQAWLTERYESQCAIYPFTAHIPLALYLRRNTRNAMLLTDDEPNPANCIDTMSESRDFAAFKLEFSTSNAAFGDDEFPGQEAVRGEECADILRQAAKFVEAGLTEGNCVDSNGNVVGSWSFQ